MLGFCVSNTFSQIIISAVFNAIRTGTYLKHFFDILFEKCTGLGNLVDSLFFEALSHQMRINTHFSKISTAKKP